ncbi:MAG: hypothetical protein U9Q22_00185 [Candidatus Altiarchaeota archaeon]|nr:hypothetical protein [Candidatus Altiarchaeota archaeon]
MISKNLKSGIILLSILAVILVFILWWFFGWYYALEPAGGTSMEAIV